MATDPVSASCLECGDPLQADDPGQMCQICVDTRTQRRQAWLALVATFTLVPLSIGLLALAHARASSREEPITGLGSVVYDRSARVVIEPYNVAARMELAASLRERAQWSLAEEQYDRVIDQEPDHVSAHLFRGVVRYELGHVDGAIADLAWAVQRTEVVPWDAWMTLGRAYRENGEYELARAALERAVQWRGSLPDPWLELAAVCQELDDSNCATHSLSRALTLAPMHPDRDALADRMRALGGTSWVVDTPTSTLPLSDVMDVYTVQVRFDQIPAQLVVDTGAAMTTISGDLATDLGLDDVEAMQRLTFSTAGGPVEMPIHRIGTLELGAMRFYDVQVSVCEACDGFDADGLLGMNVLGQVGLSLDAERGEVTIW